MIDAARRGKAKAEEAPALAPHGNADAGLRVQHHERIEDTKGILLVTRLDGMARGRRSVQLSRERSRSSSDTWVNTETSRTVTVSNG